MQAMLALLLCATAAVASHFRFGNINWVPKGGNKVEFRFTTGWRNWASFRIGSRFRQGPFFYGDGGSLQPYYTVTSLSAADNWVVGPADLITYTYSGKTATAAFYSCCRIAMRGPLSNGWWNVETRVNLNPTPGGWINSSPVSSGLPIIDIYRNVLNTWTVPAADNDGDTLTFRLATKAETTGSATRGGNPDGMTMSNGLVQWTPTTNGLYGGQVIVADSYSTVAVDYLLRVQDSKGSACSGNSNSNPSFTSPSPWIDGTLPTCFKPTFTTTFVVRARDSVDTCDSVFIQAGSVPVGASLTKKSGTNPADYTFSWKPAAANAGNHLVCFIARDQLGGSSKQECITLYVPSATSVKPTVTSVSPSQGETTGSTAITVKGTNFERGSGLFCRFSFQSVTAKTLVQAIYVSTSEVVCLAPKQPSGAGKKLTLEVSNLASCEEWSTALNDVDFYYAACPPGTAGPTCSSCPKGMYQAGGSSGGDSCIKCPAGTYGDSLGLKSSACSGTCPNGYYCPAGTSARSQFPCPAGTYGSSTGLTSSSCSGSTSAGYFSTAGSTSATQFPCAPGRYGSAGQTASTCSGPCAAGYYCPGASSTPTDKQCGGASVFCPEGSSSTSTVASGYYSVGGSGSNVRTAETECDAGHFCESGVRKQCPAGRFGSTTGLTSPTCSGPCRAGFFCPAGSSSSTADQCDTDGSGDQFCPEGTTARLTVSSGHYTTPLTAPGSQRSAEKECEEEYVCAGGSRKLRVQWTAGCRALTDLEASQGGVLGGAQRIALLSIDENGPSASSVVGLLTAESNQPGAASSVSYSVVSTRLSPAGVCTGTSPVSLTTLGTSRRVSVQGPINYEQCAAFELLVRATAGSFSVDCAVTVDVVNKNDAPELTAATTTRTVREDAPRNGLVGGPMLGVEVSDEDAGQELSFDITSGAAGIFKIGSCSGQISLAVDDALDYERQSSYVLVVTIRDDHPTDAKTVTVTVTVTVQDVNEAPRFLKLPYSGSGVLNATAQFDLVISENSPAGTALSGPDAGPSAADQDTPTATSSNTLDFAILSQDPELFAIDAATGALSVAPTVGAGGGGPAAVDFENLVGGSVSVRVRVRDGLGLASTETFAVRIVDRNDPPVVPRTVNSTVLEGAPAGTVVTDIIEGTDEDRPPSHLNFTVAAEHLLVRATGLWTPTASPASFAFGPVRVGDRSTRVAVTAAAASSTALDFERVSAVRLTLRAVDLPHAGDAAVARETTVTLGVRDRNEAPFFVGAAGSAQAATAAAAAVAPSAGQPYVTPPAAVTTVSLSVPELSKAGWHVGEAAFFDPDIVAGQTLFVTTADGSTTAFGINGQGNVTLVGDPAFAAVGAALDFETTPSYTVAVRVTDSGSPPLSGTASLVISVVDEQEPPAISGGQAFSVPENSAAGTALTGGAVLAVDPDAADNVGAPGAGLTFAVVFGEQGSLTPALPSDPSKPLFDIVASTGQLLVSAFAVASPTFHEGNDVDHETTPEALVTVRVTDTAGNAHTSTVRVRVVDANERPSDPGFGQLLAVSEQALAETAVGALRAQDVDSDDTLSFLLTGVVAPAVPGAQDACSGGTIFGLVAGGGVAGTVKLTSVAPVRPQLVSDDTQFGFGCNLTFQAVDRAGASSPTGYAWVELVRNNQPPQYASASMTVSVLESVAGGSVLQASLGASDSNSDQVLSHSIRAVRPEAMRPAFALGGSQPGALVLRPGFSLDHERTPNVTITVETKDDGKPTGLKTSGVIVILVGDVPEAPIIALAGGVPALAGMSVNENSGPGAPVGSLTATDQDRAETLRFSLAPAQASGVVPEALPFAVDAVTGAITVRAVAAGPAASGLSHESAESWAVTATVTDKDGLTDMVDFAISVLDLNEPCTATVAAAGAAFAVVPGIPGGTAASAWATAQVSEAAVPGTIVAAVTASDPDDPEHPLGWGRLTYRVVPSRAAPGSAGEAAADAAAAAAPWSTSGTAERFGVSARGELFVSAPLDAEDQERHVIVVEVLDSDASRPRGVNVSIRVRVVDSPADVGVEDIRGAVVHSSAGGDSIDFVGRSLGLTARRAARGTSGADAPAPTYTFTALATGAPDGRQYSTSACAQATAGDNSRVRCSAPPGYGTAWAWTLRWSVAYGSDASSALKLGADIAVTARTTSVRAPAVTSVAAGLRNEPTAGGSDLEIVGTDLGPVGAPVSVTYGATTGLESAATGCAVITAHVRVRCVTAAGVGTGLSVIVRVAGQSSPQFRPSSGQPLGYAPPAVSGLVVLPAASDPRDAIPIFPLTLGTSSLRTSGTPQQIVVKGENFGADAAGLVLRFGGGGLLASKYVVRGADLGCSMVVAHTVVTCEAPPGQGVGLRAMVQVGGQDSAATVDAAHTTLSFAQPTVEAVEGQGAAQGSTAGSDDLVIGGTNFPPVGDLPSPRLMYGPAPDGSLYEAEGCRVTVTGARIVCTSVEGVGSRLGAWLVVDGHDPLAAWPGKPAAPPAASLATAVSYHPPVVTGYEGPGALDASTAGGAAFFVDVTGRNFGPAAHGAVDRVAYAKPAVASRAEAGVVFVAACRVLVPHTTLRCNTSQGAGADLAWNVTIGGQLSVEPVTTYNPPTILSFGGDAAAAAASQPAAGFASARASPDGNQTIVLRGRDFGPAIKGPRYLEWVRFAPSVSGAAGANATRTGGSGAFYEARDCRVVGHREVACTMPPATGGPLFWTARVKGQTSAASPPFYVRRPRPLFIEPAATVGAGAGASPLVQGPAALARSTAGGQLVRVVGRWFGLRDPFGSVTVRWGGLTLRPSRLYTMPVPSSLVLAAEAGAAMSWAPPAPGAAPNASAPAQVLDVLEVRVPEGFGVGIPVRVAVNSLAGETVSLATDLSFSFAAPTLSFPSVREDAENPLTMMFMLLRGADLCRPTSPGFSPAAGDPPSGSVTAPANCGRVQLLNEDADDITMRSVFRTLGPAEVVSHTHGEILLHVPRGRGSVRVEVAGRVTNEVRFEQLAPGFLQGECDRFSTYAFRTVGWTAEDPSQTLTVRAFDICNASLSISIGGSACTSVTFPPLFVGTDDSTGKRICEVSCRVPPGDGTENEVIVINGGMASDRNPGAPDCVVSYAQPAVTAVYSRLDARGSPLPASSAVSVDPLGGPAVLLQGVRLVSRAGSPPAGAFVRPGRAVATPYVPQAGRDLVVSLPTEGGRLVIVGDSFGSRAFSDIGAATTATLQPDGASRSPLGDDPVILDAVFSPAGAQGHNHSVVELDVPGVGTGTGWVLSFIVAGQAVPHYVGLNFLGPSVDGIAPARTRTQGGHELTITGRSFGARSDRVAVAVGGRPCVRPRVTVPHREIRCVAPEGAGPTASVEVVVDAQSSGTAHGVALSYLPPRVDSVWPPTIPTDGTTVVTITGDNLGRTSNVSAGPAGQAFADALPASVSFLPAAARAAVDLVRTVPDPDAGTPFAHGGQLLSHNHTHIVIRAPQIQGAVRTVRVTVAGQSTADTAADASLGSPPERRLGIDAPLLTDVAPLLGPTAGYLVRFEGRSLGRVEPLANLGAKSENRGLVVVAVAPGGLERQPCSSVSTAGGQWVREYAAWDFVQPETGDRPPRPASPYTHTAYFCRLPRGFGQNITLEVSLDGIPASAASAVSRYSYAPPDVLTLVPNQPSADGRKGAFVQGSNFGSPTFGTATNEPTVSLGALPCDDPALVSDNRIDCNSRRDRVGVKVLEISAAGYDSLLFPDPVEAAAGRDVWRVETVCDIETYGQPGEYCVECPQGGVCEGPVCEEEAPGRSAISCVRFREPYADAGFWKIAQPVDLCPEQRRDRPAPFNGSCPAFLPCDPKDACLGRNLCDVGYVGERCGECLPGEYYRSNGRCIVCPDNAWLLPILFAMLVIVASSGAYILHRLDAKVEGFGTALFVAVDHMQVLSILAKTRVQWPPFLQNFLSWLSVFQFNIDLVGLDCAVPDLGYEVRWLGTELLPIAFLVIFGLLHCCLWLYKCGIMRQDKARRNDHVSSLISTSVLLFYVLYLQVTRTAFDVLNCMALDPPDGNTYLEVVFERCGQGMQARLAPFAYGFIGLYTVGFVAFAAVLLRRNKETVKIDQILRAMDVTTKTNGMDEFRKRWARFYMHFVPGQAPYWILLLLLRKALVAVVALLFGRVPAFQLASIMLILFVAFAANVRYTPYMSYTRRKEVVLQHRAKVRDGDELHKAIAHTYQRAVADRSTASRARSTGLDRMSSSAGEAADRRARLAFAARWSGDPNLMETVLLFVSMLIALTGILMESGRADFQYVAFQRDLIAYAAMVLLVGAVLYAFGIVAIEILATFLRGESGGACQCGARKGKDGDTGALVGKGKPGSRGKKLKTTGSARGQEELDSVLRDMEREAVAKTKGLDGDGDGSVGFHVNPMAAAALDVAGTGANVDAIVSSEAAPNPAQWALVRKHADGLDESLGKLRWEVTDLKSKQAARAKKKQDQGAKRGFLGRKLGGRSGIESMRARRRGPGSEGDAIGSEALPVPSAAAVKSAAAEAVVAAVSDDGSATGSDGSAAGSASSSGIDVAKVRRLSRAPTRASSARGRRRRGGPGGAEKRPSIAVLAKSARTLTERADPYDGNPTCGPWTRVHDGEGSMWYVNELTNQQRWSMPEGFDAPGAALWTPEMTAAAATNMAADVIVEAREDEEEEDEAAAEAAAARGALLRPVRGGEGSPNVSGMHVGEAASPLALASPGPGSSHADAVASLASRP